MPVIGEVGAECQVIGDWGRRLQYFLSIHPLELYTSLNRDFFKGTAVEKTADEFLAAKGTRE
ncbi:hypothetical protein [Nostoc commune]|uniref:hypothetical protein n=1 Tax=Nostoc commune TaxID=1178 RepID=UPI0020747BB6|nr:hypothetical protein [Nostoc commune]